MYTCFTDALNIWQADRLDSKLQSASAYSNSDGTLMCRASLVGLHCSSYCIMWVCVLVYSYIQNTALSLMRSTTKLWCTHTWQATTMLCFVLCSIWLLCVLFNVSHLSPAASHKVFRNVINLIFHLHLLFAISHNFDQEHSEISSA